MRPLIIQPPRNLHSINRVHPLESFGDVPGLVGLNVADEMPIDFQILETGNLLHSFLHEVLPKIALTSPKERFNCASRLLFADGENGRFPRLSVGFEQGSLNPVTDPGQVARDLSHALLEAVRYIIHSLMVSLPTGLRLQGVRGSIWPL